MADLLCGTYYPSIDQKGRMSFPTKLRDVLGAEFFLCQGHDDAYIAVYSPQAFQDYCEKLNSIKGKNGSDIRRKLLAGADKQVPDKQGRIFITQQLRDHAGIMTKLLLSVLITELRSGISPSGKNSTAVSLRTRSTMLLLTSLSDTFVFVFVADQFRK